MSEKRKYASQDEAWEFQEDLPPTKDCIRRIRTDYNSFLKENLQGIYCFPDQEIVTKYHAMIVGPFDTPYEGGFFIFTIYFPSTYPFKPPFIKHQTTGGGQIRFNPNLYRNGKVCLSILGTKGGDNDWSPAQTICSILLSIQSILNEDPYYNVEGSSRSIETSKQYNDFVRHEVLRVAVVENILNPLPVELFPLELQKQCQSLFLSFLESYELTCEENMSKDGQSLLYCHNGGKFRYRNILTNLQTISQKISNNLLPVQESSSSSSSSNSSTVFQLSSSSSSSANISNDTTIDAMNTANDLPSKS